MLSDHAILIRKIRYRETSLIVTWLTAGHGKIRTVARGGTKPSRAYGGRLDLFQESEIQWIRSKSGDLHTLTESSLRNENQALSSEYRRTLTAAYFVSLIDKTTEAEQPVTSIHHLLQRALAHLAACEMSPSLLHHFEARLCQELGIWPPNTRKSEAAFLLEQELGRLPSTRSELLRSME